MISAAGCSCHGKRFPDAHAIRTFCVHSAEKLLARDKKHKWIGYHLNPLVYSCYCNVRERERERKLRERVTPKVKCGTNSERDTYLINRAKVCVFAYFFFGCFWLKSYSQVMRNTEKKHVVSSLWYTEALQFVRVHACITLKRKCWTNSKHDTQNL